MINGEHSTINSWYYDFIKLYLHYAFFYYKLIFDPTTSLNILNHHSAWKLNVYSQLVLLSIYLFNQIITPKSDLNHKKHLFIIGWRVFLLINTKRIPQMCLAKLLTILFVHYRENWEYSNTVLKVFVL